MPNQTLLLDADGTLDTTNFSHDAGVGTPWFGHCNDAPDGVSTDYIQLDSGPADGTYIQWFSLDNVNANFISWDSLNLTIDAAIVGSVTNDTVAVTARVADADAGSTWLCDETATLIDQTDTTRTQVTAALAGVTGTEAQWNTAHVRLSFSYNRVTSADSFDTRIYGLSLDGFYNSDFSTSDMMYFSRRGLVFERRQDHIWVGRNELYLERVGDAVGGLSIPIAAYHYNHNTGSHL